MCPCAIECIASRSLQGRKSVLVCGNSTNVFPKYSHHACQWSSQVAQRSPSHFRSRMGFRRQTHIPMSPWQHRSCSDYWIRKASSWNIDVLL
jgi:hypothetical protein